MKVTATSESSGPSSSVEKEEGQHATLGVTMGELERKAKSRQIMKNQCTISTEQKVENETLGQMG